MDLCTRRLTKELKSLKKDPLLDPKITVAPNESNIREMHYVLEGSKNTPYEGGVYHGKLIFPKEYPLKPPSVMMITPNGRFQTSKRLCLSMSDYHPESWNPMWSVSTILCGLYSFMIESNPTLGSIETSTRKKRILAAQSLAWNCEHGDPNFQMLFPEYLEQYQVEKEEATKNPTKAPVVESARVTTEKRLLAGNHDVNWMAPVAGLVALFSILAMYAYQFL